MYLVNFKKGSGHIQMITEVPSLMFTKHAFLDLLYGYEIWTPYVRCIKHLERFYQRCIRSIMKTPWTSFLPDSEVLQRVGTSSTESRIINHQLRWSGSLVHLEDNISQASSLRETYEVQTLAVQTT